MSVVGPTKLIMLKTGKFEYAEVELAQPLHLVGPNNIGKTSLISCLQFLYIDDQRYMRFSREMEETRRYYFPDRQSYILFECLTPTGYQVVGVQGLGPLKQYNFQRFSYRGNFDLSDFIDEERRPRPEEDIRARFADRKYTLLEPRHLQAALTGIFTGIDEAKRVHLGLAPIRNRDQYGRFRKVFCNLLRLSHLSQEELKRFLFEINSGDFQQPVIDLEQGGYSSQYEKVKKGAKELQELQSIAVEAKKLLSLASQRSELRRGLPTLWQSIKNEFAQTESTTLLRNTEYKSKQKNLEDEDIRASQKLNDLQECIKVTNKRQGVLTHELQKLNAAGDEFSEFVCDLEEARIALLNTNSEELGILLREAAREPSERVSARIEKAEKDLVVQTALLARIAETAATKLRTILGGDENLNSVFRLLNPALLGLTIGHEGMDFLDELSLKKRVETLLGKIESGIYRDESVRIALSVLPGPDIESYTNPDRVNERIDEINASLNRDRTALESAKAVEDLRRRKNEIDRQLVIIQNLVLRYKEYQKSLEKVGEWRKELERITTQESEYNAELNKLIDRQKEISDEIAKYKASVVQLDNELKDLRSRIRILAPPDSDWPSDVSFDIPTNLLDMMSLYSQRRQNEKDIGIRITEGLEMIDARTYSRYRAAEEAETLKTLAEELDALQTREDAVQKLWTGLAADLRSAFKSLGRDLESLKSKVDELNRLLSKVSVSNLSRLRLLVREQVIWMQRIKTVVEAEDAPLFSDPKETEKALDHLGDLLRSCRRVELLDLFELNFEVSTADGNTKLYRNLESIESNGTTITIKVLVNLMLLRGLLKDQSDLTIPFYLDEASSLDRDNLLAIVNQALEIGFIPVLASPEATDVAGHVYYIKETNGRVTLDPSSSLVRVQRTAHQRAVPEKEEARGL